MFKNMLKGGANDEAFLVMQASLDALNKSQAIIEFKPDGTILTANDNFLGAMGYALAEVQGQHHRMFVDPAYGASAEYRDFWDALNRGEYQAAEYKRFGKNRKEIWIQASYNPILNAAGKILKVVKFATDITAQKLMNADFAGQIDAISKSQAVIQFNMDGTIIDANPNFLGAVGYSLPEVRGQHHRMFVEENYGQSEAYKQFWAALNRGEYQAAEYLRYGKGGREVWIQASYNPILDLNGRPCKVVKYATDITAQVKARGENERIRGIIDTNLNIIESSVENAFNQTVTADQATQSLSSKAQSMSGIIQTIDDITGRINLLSLNASIEAARAGDAGRGFSVVASEVKNLATQAAATTSKISAEVENMQLASNEVVAALGSISQLTSSVRTNVTTVARAISAG